LIISPCEAGGSISVIGNARWEIIAGADQWIISVKSIAVKVKIVASIFICAELPGYAHIDAVNKFPSICC
jgi:hypothetical protein